MQGIVLTQPVGEVVLKAMEQGLIVISAGGNVLRMVPPLIITKAHVDEMIDKLKSALQE
jgi:acetylornithine/N-succinyldiaminopimelate aminotransferase